MAKALYALSPASQRNTPIANLEGVDILLGGHDHMYFVSKGVTAWEGFDTSQPMLGAEDDEGDVLVLKSGCDFKDCSEIILELETTAAGNIRRKVIKSVTGTYDYLWLYICGLTSAIRQKAHGPTGLQIIGNHGQTLRDGSVLRLIRAQSSRLHSIGRN